MTATTRRTLLRAGALGAALVSGAGTVAATATGASAETLVAGGLYARSRFTPLRGLKFNLVGDDASWRVTLAGIRNLPGARAGDEACFTLTLRTTSAAGGPPQGTYTLRRPDFTPTEIFVVPDVARRTYQVVVNCSV